MLHISALPKYVAYMDETSKTLLWLTAVRVIFIMLRCRISVGTQRHVTLKSFAPIQMSPQSILNGFRFRTTEYQGGGEGCIHMALQVTFPHSSPCRKHSLMVSSFKLQNTNYSIVAIFMFLTVIFTVILFSYQISLRL